VPELLTNSTAKQNVNLKCRSTKHGELLQSWGAVTIKAMAKDKNRNKD
jgi:hypothetical protein